MSKFGLNAHSPSRTASRSREIWQWIWQSYQALVSLGPGKQGMTLRGAFGDSLGGDTWRTVCAYSREYDTLILPRTDGSGTASE
jgi:hypothetical protein